ncbi:MAG: hypothetical protein ACHQ4J_09815 [Candidatus Binatia bacterium]
MVTPAAGAVVLVRFPLFTANRNLITSQVGTLTPDALRSVVQAVAKILHAGKAP